MNKEMIISSGDHDTRVAILEDDQVVEIFIERERQRGVVGNIYKGRVSKVLPGMQSSFVDIGLERDAFLYVTEVVNTVEEFDRLESGDEDETPVLAAVAGDPRRPARPERGRGRRRLRQPVADGGNGRPAERRASPRDPGELGIGPRPLARRQAAGQNRRPAEGRPGGPGPGRQGAARHQGRAAHVARHDAGPLPGLHADGRPRRRLPQDRVARRARPAARHRPRVPRGARLHRRRHHPHRRGRPVRRTTSSATSPTSTRSGPRSASGWKRAGRRPCCSRSRASSRSCCATCSPRTTPPSASTTSRSTAAW